MSERTGGEDPFAQPSSYPGAGKRARRPEPESIVPEAIVPEATAVPPIEPTGHGAAPAAAGDDALSQEHQFWSDIFTQSGSDPSLTAGDTGSLPVIDPATRPVATTRGSHAGPAGPAAPARTPDPIPEPVEEPYDPFIGEDGWVRNEETGQFPPVTVDGQGLAEYTIEVPVVSDTGHPVEPVLDPAPADPCVPAAAAADLPEETAVPEQPPFDDPFDDPYDAPGAGAAPGGRRRAEVPMDDAAEVPMDDDTGEMSALGFGAPALHPADEHDQHDGAWEDTDKPRSKVGCLVLLVVLALVGAGLYLGATKGLDWVRDQFAGAEDYPGPGSGEVLFEIRAGETGAEIGRNLKSAGVVASVDAYTAAYTDAGEEKTSLIQPGTYTLRREMKAADVVTALVDPANRSLNRVTIPEGLRTSAVIGIIADKTDLPKAALEKALKDGKALGLPDYAHGNPEGFLFPATYEVSPKETAASFLKKMVDRWHTSEQKWNLEARAQKLGIKPYELMVVASLVQAEGRGKDMNKIARVIYNRWENLTGPSAGYLGIDASLMYALNKSGSTEMTKDELATPSPYNLRLTKGLPPTPINNMGDEAIDAATHPTPGDWEWYVTVNLKTGETKFATTFEEFNTYAAEYKAYCKTSDAC